MKTVEEYAKDVGGGHGTAVTVNSTGGIGVKALDISPAEHKAGEEHMAQVAGNEAPGSAEKKIETLGREKG